MAGKLGASSVVLTDKVSEHVQAVQRHNIRLNNLDDRLRAVPLPWEGKTMLAFPPVDLVLAADCFYDTVETDDVQLPQLTRQVLSVIRFFLARRPTASALVVLHQRSGSRSVGHQLGRWGLASEAIPLDFLSQPTLEMLAGADLHLFRFSIPEQ